ncbi:hypothetical protein AVEN_275281-1, partial [Araneus ventricosus]
MKTGHLGAPKLCLGTTGQATKKGTGYQKTGQATKKGAGYQKTGQATKKRDRLPKNGTHGHISNNSHGGLMLRSWLQDWRIPGSKPDSIEDLP